MKCVLIINPLSNNGNCMKHIETILTASRQKLGEISVEYASGFEEIREYSKKANLAGHDLVVAVGGDGTINAVLNGFYDQEGKRISASSMGVIYTGTSPDFCKSYNIPLDHQEAIECLSAGFVKKIRPGSINLQLNGQSHGRETRYFACCANIGIGAGIARDANYIRKYAGDLGGTFIALLKNLITYKSKKIFIEADRECDRIERLVNISVGRTPYIASGIKVDAGNIIDEEHFYLLIASGLSLSKLPGLVKQIYSGKIENTSYLQLKMAETIFLNSDDMAVEVEFDGDPAGYLPCSIELAKEGISLITNSN